MKLDECWIEKNKIFFIKYDHQNSYVIFLVKNLSSFCDHQKTSNFKAFVFIFFAKKVTQFTKKLTDIILIDDGNLGPVEVDDQLSKRPPNDRRTRVQVYAELLQVRLQVKAGLNVRNV